MFFLFLFYNLAYSNVTNGTDCSDQLRNFYLSMGMSPLFPEEQVFNYTLGTLLGIDFVTIGISIQQVALNYANSFSHIPTPNNSYITMDIPYCFSNITFSCVERIIYGITHTNDNCTILLDRDQSLGNNISGRLFIYPDPDPPCSGTASITFFNMTLVPIFNNISNSSYDIEGIYTGVLKSQTESIFSYRNAECFYTDGNVSDINSTTQFTCLVPLLQCASPRPINTQLLPPVLLTEEYRCLGFLPGTSQTSSVIQVTNHNDSITGIESEFSLQFNSTITGTLFPQTYPRQLIKPQITRQFQVTNPFINYNVSSNIAGGYNFTSTSLSLPPIPFQYLQFIPCLCGFSVFCDSSGSLDTTETGNLFFQNNTIPIGAGNTTTPFVRIGDFALLNNNGFDPDDFPQPVTFYAIQVQSPNINNINITIINPSDQFNITFQTFPYTENIYTIMLLVSDGQDLNFTLVNVTAVTPFPQCILEPQISGEVNETIFLNATASFDVLGVNLTGYWIQITGFPVNITNNDTLLASFITNFSGTYIFQVNITNGLENCTFQQIVLVNPQTFAPINDPNTTLPPYLIPPNRSVPPIDINQTDIPTVTDPPFFNPIPNATVTPVPTGNTPIFPPVPPASPFQNIVFWVLFAIFLAIDLLMIFWVFIMKNDDENYLFVPNKYIINK